MRAKKLPSGSWRCQVFAGTEKVVHPDGSVTEKKIRKSFTVSDPSPAGRKECERQAAMWAAEREHCETGDMTVREAIEEFLEDKENILSPSTIRAYRSNLRTHLDGIGDIKLSKLRERDVQKWINDLATVKPERCGNAVLAPKTIKNIYGLLSKVLDTHRIRFRITLPQPKQTNLYVPSDAQIQALIDFFAEDNKDMLCAVYLAAFGSLRRSEICALTADDIDGNVVHVRKALVMNSDNEAVEKTTKTVSSTRDVIMPDFVIEQLPKEGKIVSLTPSGVTDHFRHALVKLDLPHFRFHDLRHYTASIMHAIDIPDQYIMARGGWSSDGTLKRIYRNTLDDYEQKFTDKLMDHFEKMEKGSHESSHDPSEMA